VRNAMFFTCKIFPILTQNPEYISILDWNRSSKLGRISDPETIRFRTDRILTSIFWLAKHGWQILLGSGWPLLAWVPGGNNGQKQGLTISLNFRPVVPRCAQFAQGCW
jgi:hypothetical protein